MTTEMRFPRDEAEAVAAARTPEQILLLQQQRTLDKIEFLLWIILSILAFGIYLLVRQAGG
ncbi:hypothetical protein [Chthonobacter albigriseus]|uniref:hypothetical protein n=1 Tax=Chthonobacter albigriseus TaxID=1683161 RepID=UPI0015EECC85|nr:hypothetical protein [Chthonobacter albigriseus]